MGLDDKIKNAAQDLQGKAKEATGKATDNERLEAEGRMERPACPDRTDGRFGGKVLERNPVFVCPVPFMQIDGGGEAGISAAVSPGFFWRVVVTRIELESS